MYNRIQPSSIGTMSTKIEEKFADGCNENEVYGFVKIEPEERDVGLEQVIHPQESTGELASVHVKKEKDDGLEELEFVSVKEEPVECSERVGEESHSDSEEWELGPVKMEVELGPEEVQIHHATRARLNRPIHAMNSGNPTRTLEMKYYKDVLRCFVPSCKKYRRDFPNSAYLSMPPSLQATWCHALEMNCPKRNLYVCEEHINIEEDCYKNKAGKLQLKKSANLILTKTYDESEMQSDKTNLTEDALDSSKDLPSTSMQFLQYGGMPYSKCDFSTQVKFANKAVLMKPAVKSVGSVTNIRVTHVAEKVKPSQPSSFTASRSLSPSQDEPSSSPSSSSPTKDLAREKDMAARAYLLKIIKENPKMYLGVPKRYYWLIDFLAKKCKLRSLHIIITLFKLKQNDSFQRMSHNFNLNKVTLQKIVRICIPHMATYLQMFIYLPEPITIKKTLPPVYKVRYANVQCLLDSFEIQIEKPSNPVMQARTWSQYKSCNTLKYLVACCPNGFICFISKGYGGRISDKAITECSGFVDILPPGAVVLADRGFKGIESLLTARHAKLLRPPSVSSKETPTKKEVILTKIIESLRIHVERVIRRLREFTFLKPHSVINHNHVKYVDEAVVIACALVNLQGNIMKI